MTPEQAAIAAALEDIERARQMLQKLRAPQVRSAEHRQYLRALALSWFHSRRPALQKMLDDTQMRGVDQSFRIILDSTEKLAARSTYLSAARAVKAELIELRGALLSAPTPAPTTSDSAPDFTKLAGDPVMRAILASRWDECTKCVNASAFLAATVMMGGMLEALFVARANRMTDKAPLFKASSAPVDPRTRKPLDLRQWMLASYIDVAHELGWISRSAKDVAVVLRDYRNYVHPEKERSHGVTLTGEDARMFWELTKTLANQLLAS